MIEESRIAQGISFDFMRDGRLVQVSLSYAPARIFCTKVASALDERWLRTFALGGVQLQHFPRDLVIKVLDVLASVHLESALDSRESSEAEWCYDCVREVVDNLYAWYESLCPKGKLISLLSLRCSQLEMELILKTYPEEYSTQDVWRLFKRSSMWVFRSNESYTYLHESRIGKFGYGRHSVRPAERLFAKQV